MAIPTKKLDNIFLFSFFFDKKMDNDSDNALTVLKILIIGDTNTGKSR